MMQSFFDQNMVKQRIDELRREAALAHAAEQAEQESKTNPFQILWHPVLFLLNRRKQKRIATLHAALAQHAPILPKQVAIERIKPALLMTFITLHNKGLVSDFDERFIETFMQALEEEIARQSCVAASRKSVQ